MESNASSSPGRLYTAFLSYRHADNREDGRRWAEWLHHAIETYEVPHDLVGKTNLHGEPIPASLYPVFRDEEELPAAADLSGNILRALQNSRSLVVLCSPRACGSHFVADEIHRFKELGKSSRILALLLDGEPNVSESPDGIEASPLECLPRELRYGVPSDDGKIDWTRRCVLLIAADARPGGEPKQGYTASSAYRMALERGGLEHASAKRLAAEYEARLQQARFKILAGLLGVLPSQLLDRDAAHRLRRARRQRRIALAVAAFAVALTVFALWQRQVAQTERHDADVQRDEAKSQRKEADRQREEAIKQEKEATAQRNRAVAELKEASRSDFVTAQQRLAEHKWQEAVAYLGRAIRYDPENREAQDGFWLALRYGQRDAGAMPLLVFQQEGDIVSAGFSPDGSRIVTAGKDHAVRVWDATTGQPIGKPLPHPAIVTCAKFSPDGSRIVTACGEVDKYPVQDDPPRAPGEVRFWDAGTEEPAGPPLPFPDAVTDVAFDRDGSRMAVTCLDGKIHLWKTNPLQASGPPIPVSDLRAKSTFSADGSCLLIEADAGGASLWDLVHHKWVNLPFGAGCAHAAFNPSGDALAAVEGGPSGNGGRVQMFDLKRRRPFGKPLQTDDAIIQVRFSPDGSRVVVASGDNIGSNPGKAQVWDFERNRLTAEAMPHPALVLGANYSPDGSRIVTAGYDGTARVWDADTGLPLTPPLEHGDRVDFAVFGPDGRRVLTLSRDGRARLWSALEGSGRGSPLPLEGIDNAGFRADDSRIITANDDGAVRLWDARTALPGDPLPTQPAGPVKSVVFSPDGTLAAFVSGMDADSPIGIDPKANRLEAAYAVQVWDLESRRPVREAHRFAERVEQVDFSGDSSHYSIVTSTKAQVFPARSSTPPGEPVDFAGEGLTASALNRDASQLVTTDDKEIRFRDTRSGEEIPPGIPCENAGALCIDPAGSRLAVAVGEKIDLWNLARRDGKASLAANPARTNDGTPITAVDDIVDLRFSPDGTLLVAAGRHSVFPNRLGRVAIWDANSRRPLAPPLLFPSEVNHVALDRNGHRMLTVESSGLASLWDIRPDQPIAGPQAEDLAEVCAGARLDPERGGLRKSSPDERRQAWERLRTTLTDPDWHLLGEQSLTDLRPDDSLSPHFGFRVRQSATFLLRAGDPDRCAELLKFDPGHPLLPFGLALRKEKREGEETESERKLSNAAYSAWLCRYGLAHLPADVSADDLRLGAKLVAKAGETLPAVKKVGLELLDRAARIAPEDDETKKLRRALK